MIASGMRRGESVSCHLSLSFPAKRKGSLSCTRSRPVLPWCAHWATSADKDVIDVTHGTVSWRLFHFTAQGMFISSCHQCHIVDVTCSYHIKFACHYFTLFTLFHIDNKLITKLDKRWVKSSPKPLLRVMFMTDNLTESSVPLLNGIHSLRFLFFLMSKKKKRKQKRNKIIQEVQIKPVWNVYRICPLISDLHCPCHLTILQWQFCSELLTVSFDRWTNTNQIPKPSYSCRISDGVSSFAHFRTLPVTNELGTHPPYFTVWNLSQGKKK